MRQPWWPWFQGICREQDRGPGAIRPRGQRDQILSPLPLGLIFFAYWNEHPEDAEVEVILTL